MSLAHSNGQYHRENDVYKSMLFKKVCPTWSPIALWFCCRQWETGIKQFLLTNIDFSMEYLVRKFTEELYNSHHTHTDQPASAACEWSEGNKFRDSIVALCG